MFSKSSIERVKELAGGYGEILQKILADIGISAEAIVHRVADGGMELVDSDIIYEEVIGAQLKDAKTMHHCIIL